VRLPEKIVGPDLVTFSKKVESHCCRVNFVIYVNYVDDNIFCRSCASGSFKYADYQLRIILLLKSHFQIFWHSKL